MQCVDLWKFCELLEFGSNIIRGGAANDVAFIENGFCLVRMRGQVCIDLSACEAHRVDVLARVFGVHGQERQSLVVQRRRDGPLGQVIEVDEILCRGIGASRMRRFKCQSCVSSTRMPLLFKQRVHDPAGGQKFVEGP